nr:MAG TPA: hypothetical protein [Caudoviricetes sp.]
MIPFYHTFTPYFYRNFLIFFSKTIDIPPIEWYNYYIR